MANNLIEINWIDDFIKTDAFSEVLCMVWRNGYKSSGYFQFTHKSQTVVEKFAEYFGKETRSRYREDKGYVEWYKFMNSGHLFIKKTKELGWTPIQEKSITRYRYIH